MTACPVERSGQEEFVFEFGKDFRRHISAVNATFCKVLVRYNSQGDRAMNGRHRRDHCVNLVAAARRGGRNTVDCIVLGRGESVSTVRSCSRTATRTGRISLNIRPFQSVSQIAWRHVHCAAGRTKEDASPWNAGPHNKELKDEQYTGRRATATSSNPGARGTEPRPNSGAGVFPIRRTRSHRREGPGRLARRRDGDSGSGQEPCRIVEPGEVARRRVDRRVIASTCHSPASPE